MSKKEEKRKGKEQTFQDVPARVDVNALERGVLEFWEKDKTFEKSLKQRAKAKLFTFYDGPPYATGKPHYGHVLQSAIKDAVLRYKTMRGYYVPRIVGWDTHGLPVEVFVEKELGFKNKKDIEAFGIEKFNQKCREVVFRYIDVWVETLKRLGRWADYNHGYATLDRDYMEKEWWVFKQLWDKGLVYKDFRSTPYCIRCGTPLSNYEAGEGYKDKTDTAVYVKLKSTKHRAQSTNNPLYLLVWTTTPWTLPANVAVAISEKLEYVSVEFGGEEFVVAKERIEAVFGKELEIKKAWKLEELLQLKYENLFSTPSEEASSTPGVVAADHVTAEEGTGLVHMAPAFGAEDQQVAKKNNLPIIRNVDASGVYTEGPFRGEHIWKANPKIVEDLKKRGLLFKQEQYTHSYPHCWRCDQPLIYYALDTWFVKVTGLKNQMLKANERITWIPEHIKQGRFAKGIEAAPDWAVSRNRFWSVPMPVWECDVCEERVCVGGSDELGNFSGKNLKDLHRPFVDEITWPHKQCAGTFKRIPEVLDVWFDSGSMPFTQAGFPADFIAESIEMTRAWFYFMHVLDVAVKNKPAFRNVIGSGIIFGSDGNKLSKKLKNYPEIEPTIKKYGADTVRMFFLSSTFGEPYVFSEKELQELFRNFTMRLWNVYSFFVQYANVQKWTKKKTQSTEHKAQDILDVWILARLKQLEHDVITASDAYRMDNAARAFMPFVDDLSNWYVRRSRDRFQPKGDVDTSAFQTLHAVLMRLVKLLAPFMPFITDAIYQNIAGKESVHLQDLEDVPKLSDNEVKLLENMAQVREIVSLGLAQRAKAGIKVRQPLGRIDVGQQMVTGSGFSDELVELIKDELNVKEVKVAEEIQEDQAVRLETAVTPELKLEGIARDIIRQGQVLRKRAGYKLNDKICLGLVSESIEIEQMLSVYQDEIMHALQAKRFIREGTPDEDMGEDVTIGGQRIHLGVKKKTP